MKRIAVFASGQGTNATGLIRHFRGSDAAQVVWVVSNRPDALVLERANNLGIDTVYMQPEAFINGRLKDELKARKIDIIVLAGFLKLIPADIISAYVGKIINLHPSLLPKFGGKGMYGSRVHEAVVAAGESVTGITIHHVNEHFDEGKIIAQFSVPVVPGDDAASVEKKVRELEKLHFAATVEKWILSEK